MDIGNVQNVRRVRNLRNVHFIRQRKIYKIRKNPYIELTNNEFRKKYRFSKAECLQIVNEIRDFLPRAVNNRGKPISPSLQLLIALRYLARGQLIIDYVQDDSGDLHGVSQPTGSRCLSQICRSLASLKNNYIKFPLTNEELATKKADFHRKFNMPSIIGAIDCTHIRIKKVICDANCHILHVIDRWRGSAHDSRIWNESLIKEQFENGSINGILLSDSGYACTPYMLTPILNPQNDVERQYNYTHIRARNTIERLFGQIKQRFRCLLRGMTISLENAKVDIVVLSVLHNMKLHFKKHLNINNINPNDNNNSSTEDSSEDDDYNEESESDSSADEDNYNVVQINQNRGNVARAKYIRQFLIKRM
ncbi:putative nuclease HARBI1 [Acyrthosiphon pisum]|uniref:DDE Tnp4 domain-containing protein n=1 Tax=Acyrthosiphon pisum TaxID=7029 RepID=A0A8R1WXW7_ACYPI|nr:putative nuclease HARBI1 [Acyrthosiphon pisum]|eukprot:XP_008178797.1 PREDICTED: putative nuclease HARBI1 [Acyrthosiphon pisum]